MKIEISREMEAFVGLMLASRYITGEAREQWIAEGGHIVREAIAKADEAERGITIWGAE